jgi:hypothetical protein
MLDFYADTEPNAQSTVDIFKGEWLSVLPGGLNSGWADLFNVSRVAWPNSLFNISGKSVLELGPLEGGHSFALHHIGAATITAVEANSRAFLKCLIIKGHGPPCNCGDEIKIQKCYGRYLEGLPERDGKGHIHGIIRRSCL